jgi:hypothetical protein
LTFRQKNLQYCWTIKCFCFPMVILLLLASSVSHGKVNTYTDFIILITANLGSIYSTFIYFDDNFYFVMNIRKILNHKWMLFNKIAESGFIKLQVCRTLILSSSWWYNFYRCKLFSFQWLVNSGQKSQSILQTEH